MNGKVKAAVKPALVLAILTAVICTALILMNTYLIPDTSAVVTDKLAAAYSAVNGEKDEGLRVVADWKAEGYAIDKPDSVAKLLKDSEGGLSFEIVADGYNAGGVDVLVVMKKDGTVKGVAFVTNNETPGIGSRAENSDFLGQFAGKNESAAISDNDIKAVSGATYTSKGVVKAVNTAIETYKKLGIT